MFADRRAALISMFALVAACAACAACNDTTGLRATVTFGQGFQPSVLMVTARVTDSGESLVMSRSLQPEAGRKIASGDSFVLLLPDRLDGARVSLFVDALDASVTLSGSREETVRKGSVVDVEIPLGTPPDGGADGAPSDGGGAEGGAPDLALPDLTQGDIAGGPDGGGGCGDPLPLPVGTTSGTIGGFSDHTNGSCGGLGGADVVGRIALTDWRTVTIDSAGSQFDTLLYARSECGNAFSELPRHGPCPGATTAPGMACNDDAQGTTSRLVLCGLPAGAYHAWLDSKPNSSGTFSVNVATSAVDLNSCAGAGNLLGGGMFTASTTMPVMHADNFFSDKAHGCKTGDRGMGGLDAVFFLALDRTSDVTISTAGTQFNHLVYMRPSCAVGNDIACANGGTMLSPLTLPLTALAPGLYYVIVDGAGAMPSSGEIKLTVTLK